MELNGEMTEFFTQYSGGLFRYARRFLQTEDAEDAVSDILLVFYVRYRGRYRPDEIGKVMYKALYNKILKKLAKAKKFTSYEENKEIYDARTTEIRNRDERLNYLSDAMEFLTPYQRTIVKSLYFDGLDKKELAAFFNTSVSAVNRTLERALKVMRGYIESAVDQSPQGALERFKKSHRHQPKSKQNRLTACRAN